MAVPVGKASPADPLPAILIVVVVHVLLLEPALSEATEVYLRLNAAPSYQVRQARALFAALDDGL